MPLIKNYIYLKNLKYYMKMAIAISILIEGGVKKKRQSGKNQ